MADHDQDQLARKLLTILQAVTAFLDGAYPTMKKAERHTARLAMVLSGLVEQKHMVPWVQEARADLLEVQAVQQKYGVLARQFRDEVARLSIDLASRTHPEGRPS